ncbi:rho gtpase-activating protein 8 [Moniliophthora roreri]|uniref:Rho-GAP domain-containing protein n=1 Tax=Moniliophthora roreri TaxID=221103 RepID=A0A0W0G547_MONRR|nr:rho gtpase-activating protein 8 [Moniliophthora roreri]
MSPNGLSLKQRLTALSIAPSAPSSPHNYDQSPASPRRKSFFASPWSSSRRHADSEQQESEMVQEVMAKLIFQAGVDFETRPMVVLNASALPDPRLVNYDILLSRILSYLNLYVESDYTVVFFAAGAKHNPGWNWVWKAYRSLSRKYRKNLKRLYVVHSSFFSKMLFSLAGAVISPKFFRKITYIDTLSDLAYHIPLTQIDIPPAVYQENHKHEKTITLPTPMPSSTFGVPLEDIMGYEGEKGGIPRVVRDAIQFLRETGMQEDGLFRRSPSSAMLRAAQEAYDRGNVVSLDTFGDPHLAAVLLKKYLRDLPEPMFPESLYPTIRRCPMPTSDPGDMSAVMYVREILLPELPPCVYILLSHILHLMHEVSLHVATNRMDAHNLSIVLCPNLVKGTNPAKDVMMCTAPGGPVLFDSSTTTSSASQQQQPQSNTTLGTVIKLCIQRYYEIFDEVHDRTEAVGQETHEDVQYDEMVGGEGRGVSRGFGFGVDMELSESEGEGEGEITLGGVGYGRGGEGGYTPTSTSGLASLRPGVVWEGSSSDGHGSLSGHGSVEDYDEPQEVRLQHHRRQSSGKHSVRTNATDEEIDDTMLIMPIGPEPSSPRTPQMPTLNGHHSPSAWSPPSSPATPMAWGGHGPPSAWGAGAGTSRFTTVGANYATYKPKSRRAPPSNGNPYGSGTVTPKSASSSIIGSGQGQNSTFSTKSRSVISIEKGLGAAGVGTIGKKGSISVGRGTTRKSIGSGVEAVGITAEGFFTPPPGTGGA